MHTSEADAAVEALDDGVLRARLGRKDWRGDPLFIPDEQVFTQFRLARANDDKARVGLLAEALNERVLEHSRRFALKMGMVPGLIDDPRRAALEIASCIWEHLLASASLTSHDASPSGSLSTSCVSRTVAMPIKPLGASSPACADACASATTASRKNGSTRR